MAYNIMKGTVEFSSGTGSIEGTVDLSSDQSVAGGKTSIFVLKHHGFPI